MRRRDARARLSLSRERGGIKLSPPLCASSLPCRYVDARLPGHERRALLRAHYRFECACERCAPEVEAEERDHLERIRASRLPGT